MAAAVTAVFEDRFRKARGRVEVVDPIGRTACLIFFRDDRAWCAVPGKKIYAEDGAEPMMTRFLGVALLPGEALRLLSGTWEDDGPASGWSVERDERGRPARGEQGRFAFAVREFFPGASVPREIGLAGPGTSGRVKILRLGFNPPRRDEAFDISFLRSYALKTWDELVEGLDR